MFAALSPTFEAHPQQPVVSLAEWTRAINQLAAPAELSRAAGGELMLANGASPGYRMAPDVAEQLVAAGLNPDYLVDLAALSGLEPRDLFDFAGIDRTTVSRRKASGSALPQDAAVKALQATDLLTQATEAFGTPSQASTWLTRPHPVLDGETPLRRARTPWGMGKVLSMLAALRYGAAV